MKQLNVILCGIVLLLASLFLLGLCILNQAEGGPEGLALLLFVLGLLVSVVGLFFVPEDD